MDDVYVADSRYFLGTKRLYGEAGFTNIQNAHIAIVGIGGVGSWGAEVLARTGIGAITLIDLDHINPSNINRQIHALGCTIGMAKVQAMKERIALINPGCQVYTVEEFVEPHNWPQLLPTTIDGLIDACDQKNAKIALCVWAKKYRKYFVTVGAAGGKRMYTPIRCQDLSQSVQDRLLSKVRYALRKHHGFASQGNKMGIHAVFCPEPSVSPNSLGYPSRPSNDLNCHGYGSIATVTASFGLHAANFILNQLVH